MSVAVPDRKKIGGKNAADQPEKVDAAEPEEKFRHDAAIKLRKEFKEQLEAVAADFKMYPGKLVEERLGQFIRTEYRRILQERLKKIDEA